jgi:hypothetical protein
MAFVAPSQDLPLRFNQVSTLDATYNPTSTFNRENIVRINSTVEMALEYDLASVYYNFTSDVTYRIIVSVSDPNNMPVYIYNTQKTIARGEIQNTLSNYTIASNAVLGNYKVKIMLWSDWLPSGNTLSPSAEEVTFNVS